MLVLSPEARGVIRDHVETAYPREGCGLLVGRHDPEGRTVVLDVVPTDNHASGDQQDSFEIDPQVHMNLLRTLRGGEATVVGHFHSHPDHPAAPSARDHAMAHDPKMIWVIAAVADGCLVALSAYRLDEGTFKPLELHDAE
ncbi:Mov34/MPN/PAD-1 family protein [Magnetospira sp. QH-2]|uniref:Mov34/MPN/PAD-1 family protein n=1 Tax=Magnetospira sp. (strain QH-2) TaxID=1288970 RepID=UPI0003E81A8A|nr:M67 family metallopeptidase [Magnetospira sp. QH-2]CCQ75043.1 conserved protein of unknown function[Include Mov34/MPN/PAD-1 family domain] [Magnetospira sp. QH-2]